LLRGEEGDGAKTDGYAAMYTNAQHFVLYKQEVARTATFISIPVILQDPKPVWQGALILREQGFFLSLCNYTKLFFKCLRGYLRKIEFNALRL
jgi:hypothetical protein